MTKRIVIDPAIHHGQPVIAGTRTPVAVVLDSLAAGDTEATLCREYDLTVEQVRDCIAFASNEIKSNQYHPIPA